MSARKAPRVVRSHGPGTRVRAAAAARRQFVMVGGVEGGASAPQIQDDERARGGPTGSGRRAAGDYRGGWKTSVARRTGRPPGGSKEKGSDASPVVSPRTSTARSSV